MMMAFSGRFRLFTELSLIVLMILTGSAYQPAQSATAPVEFVMLVNNQPNSIDPHIGSSNPDLEILRAAYETLVELDAATSKLLPLLATNWVSNDDATAFTFTLRRGVKFHDGGTLTAEAVKQAFERSLTINRGESYLIKVIDRIETPDARTVRFRLKAPTPEFVFNLTRIFIPSPKALKEKAVGGDLAQGWLAQNTAGSGPYKMTSWERGQRIILDKFDEYWRGWDGSRVSRYVLRLVPEPGTQRLIMERGEGDFADSITVDDAIQLKNSPRLDVVAKAGNPIYVLINPKGPLADRRVRRAIALAYDYDSLVNDIMKGFGVRMAGAIPDSMLGSNPNVTMDKLNLDEAKRLLAEAGHPNGGFTLRYVYFESWIFERDAGLVWQNNLKKLGIDMKVEGLPWATMIDQIVTPDRRPDLAMVAQFTPTPSPLPLLEPMYSAGSKHWSYLGYYNPRVEYLLAKAAKTVDQAEREKVYKELEMLLWQDQASIFAMQKPDIAVFRKGVKGFKYNWHWSLILNYYDISKE
jgi:peptide/nickel transport system substrate-binding protein